MKRAKACGFFVRLFQIGLVGLHHGHAVLRDYAGELPRATFAMQARCEAGAAPIVDSHRGQDAGSSSMANIRIAPAPCLAGLHRATVLRALAGRRHEGRHARVEPTSPTGTGDEETSQASRASSGQVTAAAHQSGSLCSQTCRTTALPPLRTGSSRRPWSPACWWWRSPRARCRNPAGAIEQTSTAR